MEHFNAYGETAMAQFNDEDVTIVFRFNIILNGIGQTVEEAWDDVIEGFTMDPGPTPEAGEYEVIVEGPDGDTVYSGEEWEAMQQKEE